jgi:hypothetical protein
MTPPNLKRKRESFLTPTPSRIGIPTIRSTSRGAG